MYEVERVSGGYQVWHQEENRPTDDEKIYPSRQNAYVKRGQLNELPRGQVFTVTVRLERKDCRETVEVFRRTFGNGIEFFVVDPLEDIAPEVRNVTFKYLCASPLPEAQVIRHRFSRRYPPFSQEDFTSKIAELAKMLPILQSIKVEPSGH